MTTESIAAERMMAESMTAERVTAERVTERTVDVLVVGGATTGLYFGGLMAAAGYRVLICDQSAAATLGGTFDIIHLARDQFALYNLPEPQPGSAEYVSCFSHFVQKSALNNWPKNSYNETLVLRRVPLIARLARWAVEQGAELLTETRFVKPLFDGNANTAKNADTAGNAGNTEDAGNAESAEYLGEGCLCGGLFEAADGSQLIVRARLTADASGIPAVVRTALPTHYGMETFATGPRDQFFVILHYFDLDEPQRDAVNVTTTWTHYKCWLAPQHGSGGALAGVGANLSYDYAELVYQRFKALGYLPPHTPTHEERGFSPYRRTPHALVANRFVALGSAACISNPWSGEGVPYSWLECKLAAEVACSALAEGGEATRAALWPLTGRYFAAQGALFAKNLAMLSGAVDCTPAENDYEYARGIIYEDHDEQGNSLERGSMGGKLLRGLLTGKISLRTLRKLMAASRIGEQIEKHYLAYPATPDGLPAWVAAADALWAKAGSMASVAEADLAANGGAAGLATNAANAAEADITRRVAPSR